MTAKRKPAAPFYAVAALWLLGGLFLPLYSKTAVALMALVSAAVFFAVGRLCRGGETAAGSAGTEKKEEAPKKPEPAPSTGNPELDKAIKDGKLALGEMKRLDDSIADPGVSADIVRLSQVSEKIFQAVRDDPDKLPQIRKFMDYYLPTTLKLLNAYDRMSGAGVSGENIDGTKVKVEDMLKTIVRAFEKQLDALYGADALDVSTDIQVMETLLAREGLTEPEMKADPVQADGTDIKLEL
ncbi:5-bromo-4-chloroindolyl phosphate hydrolysis family protein [Oscillibacter sp.]|uniref:5-bromo-4-chloroindolyl phosphate hydrolysis family protein n=1 Tax=Oscillibacter sp. TaxID=1945593 RepID=UPI002D7E8E8B|nr:5-bromo-4-chloroindolyl phosphate hydrolysis family protein [Oscillibacter sp.]